MFATKNEEHNRLLLLHLTVFIWGFTGILGKLISIPAVPMVWYRVMIGALTLLPYLWIKKIDYKVSRQHLIKLFLTGGVLAAHWIFFFHSIKISTVSVALVCLSTVTLFTAILEPIVKKQRIQRSDIFIGLCIVLGIYLIFKFEGGYTEGIIFGISAAIAASIFSTANSTFVQKIPATIIGFYELMAAWIMISIYLLCTNPAEFPSFDLRTSDWLYLVLLGTFCTSFAYAAGVSVMRSISAFRVALASNLEPIYGIVLAYLFFAETETMTGGFYLGAILILTAVFLYPIYKRKTSK